MNLNLSELGLSFPQGHCCMKQTNKQKKCVSQQNVVSMAKVENSICRQPLKSVITELSHDNQGQEDRLWNTKGESWNQWKNKGQRKK